jgi:hypothetical protein
MFLSEKNEISTFILKNIQIYRESQTGDWDEGRQETGYFLLPIKSQNKDKPTKVCFF